MVTQPEPPIPPVRRVTINNGGQMLTAIKVLTVSVVAAELRCSKAHVYNLISGRVAGSPKLPSIHLGRRRLVLLATLITWISNIERGAPIGS